MIQVLLGLLLLGLVIYAMRRLVAAPPSSVVKGLRVTGLALLAGGGLFLAVTGRLFLLLPWLLRLFQMRGTPRPQSARPGQRSEVTSAFLRMELDHDTGAMNGEILAGAFRGRLLDRMTREELAHFWREAQQDADSLQLLEAWFDRHWADWREVFAQGSGGAQFPERPAGPMSKEEACHILGVGPNASTEEIKAAHRRLMMKVHPDVGGSAYLAARINEARSRLLTD